ncbi:SET domain-containing protein [Variovorax sp. EBFNA2]|uniref:SET domain-containing protein n=1 Tax=Variovorax sp. EBFNA2 TaxID=3342097 RepID=UPI0029C0F550|nr:SET domain-containing protein [Variovorax boronicumulans]WPG41040.1 SET domain-containing protein [Variovorax boronicumulans]
MQSTESMTEQAISDHPHIEVRHSDVHGAGAFALCDLPRGSLIGLYTGRRYSADEAHGEDWDNRLTYLFGLSDGTTIDGAEGGNATRHLNHACEPNCEAQEEYGEGGQLVLRIEAIRRIRAGEELFIDYALNVDANADPQDYSCQCGSLRCRGTLLAPLATSA